MKMHHLEKCWQNVEVALRAVFDVVMLSDNNVNFTLNSTLRRNQMLWYNEVYQACNQPGTGSGNNAAGGSACVHDSHLAASILYDRVLQLVGALSPKVTQSLEDVSGRQLIAPLARLSVRFRLFVRYTVTILSFISRVVTTKEPLNVALVNLFKERVLRVVLSSKLRDAVLGEIETFRLDGAAAATDLDLSREVVSLACDFGIYMDDLEGPILAESETYFRQAQCEIVAMDNISGYTARIHDMMKTEETLSSKLLHTATTREKLNKLFETILLDEMLPKIITNSDAVTGVASLVENDRWGEIEMIYRLAVRSSCHIELFGQQIARVVESHGETLNEMLVLSTDVHNRHKVYISECLHLVSKSMNKLREHLDGNYRIYQLTNGAVAKFFNAELSCGVGKGDDAANDAAAPALQPVEQLVLFMDNLLQRNADVLALLHPTFSSDFECVDACLTHLFKNVHEKDLFQELYKMKLARRLLGTYGNTCRAFAELDLERHAITQLKMIMGTSYTHGMEQMLQDVENSKAVQESFEASSNNKSNNLLSVSVLTSAVWSHFKTSSEFTPPESLLGLLQSFERFYKSMSSTHAARKLQWVFSMGSCTLEGDFTPGSKSFITTNYQAFLLFKIEAVGKGNWISVADLAAAVGVPPARIKPHLAVMCFGKGYQILSLRQQKQKESSQLRLHDDDELTYNDAFKSPLRRVRLPVPTNDASKQRTAARDRTEENRKYVVDASIVRFMKARREVLFNDLFQGVVDMLTKVFVVDVRLVRLRIDELVTRGYITQCKTTKTKLIYVA
eukprot:PhM_4_TR18417/c0_g1_i1/m.56043/K03347/CUL1, CDC53; cullin 1